MTQEEFEERLRDSQRNDECCGGGSDSVAELARELNRRVRWLESVLLQAEAEAWGGEPRVCADTVSEAVLIYSSQKGGEKRVKPTPENFH